MNAELEVSGEIARPQERVTSLMTSAFEMRMSGRSDEAIVQLETAQAAARVTPYEIEFQTRIQLAMTLADCYLAAGQIQKASDMLVDESKFAEKISQIMQSSGTPAQKRTAMSGYLQVRDRSIQMGLLGREAPDIAVKEWLQGGTGSLADLRGKVVLLEFWATWCKPCQEMFPKLKKLHVNEREQGLEVIALTRHYMAYGGPPESMLEERQLMLGMVAEHSVDFHVGIAMDERLQGAFGANGLPTVVVIDRSGIIQYAGPGEEGQLFENQLKRCLEQSV